MELCQHIPDKDLALSIYSTNSKSCLERFHWEKNLIKTREIRMTEQSVFWISCGMWLLWGLILCSHSTSRSCWALPGVTAMGQSPRALLGNVTALGYTMVPSHLHWVSLQSVNAFFSSAVPKNPMFSFHQVCQVFISLNSSICHGEKDGEWHHQPLMFPISFVTLLFSDRQLNFTALF